MKKTFKLMALVVVSVLALSLFTACQNTANDAEKAPQQNATNNTPKETEKADTPKAKESVIMGTNAYFPPFEFITDNGLVDKKYSGIDVEIALEIAKKMGKELKVEDMSFESLLGAVSTDKINFAAAGMTANDKRRKEVDFSDTYYVAKQGIIVKKDSTIDSVDDIKDKRIAAILGYTGDTYCRETLKATNLTSLKRGVDAVMDLKNGKFDAVVIDYAPAMQFVEKNPDLKVVEDPTFEAEEYAIAVKKGNKELLDTINAVIKDLKDSGKLDEIIAKYN